MIVVCITFIHIGNKGVGGGRDVFGIEVEEEGADDAALRHPHLETSWNALALVHYCWVSSGAQSERLALERALLAAE